MRRRAGENSPQLNKLDIETLHKSNFLQLSEAGSSAAFYSGKIKFNFAYAFGRLQLQKRILLPVIFKHFILFFQNVHIYLLQITRNISPSLLADYPTELSFVLFIGYF